MNMYVWIVIIGGSIVTILPRILPIMFIAKLNLNEKSTEFLKLIPIAILSALVLTQLFIVNNKMHISIPETIALIPTVIVAIKKNNLLLTVIIGIVSVALLRFKFS